MLHSAAQNLAKELTPASWRWPAWVVLVALLMAFSIVPAHSAELRIGTAQGNPGDTVEIMLSLQGDGTTVSASFLLDHSYVADYSNIPATVLASGVTCQKQGSLFRVTWSGAANSSLTDLCIIRMTIRELDQPYNGALFGQSQQCLDLGNYPQECSVERGHIEVIYGFLRSFIGVLRDPPHAPAIQELVGFDYSNTGATAPLGFLDTVRPERVSGGTIWPQSSYGQWVLANPQSPISLLATHGVRFTFSSLEQRAQALALARHDPAFRDIVEDLTHVGPRLTYPAPPRESQPFGLFIAGPACPHISIDTPESRTIEIDGNRIDINLHDNKGQVCGTQPPGFSAAVVQIPGLAAGIYNVHVETAAWPQFFLIVVHPADLSITSPSIIPNPDVRVWLILGVLLLAAWRLRERVP